MKRILRVYGFGSFRSFKENSTKHSARVFLSSIQRTFDSTSIYDESALLAKKNAIRGVTGDAGKRESDCTKFSARLLRYVALRYVTVNGGRVRVDRIATVLRDLEERPPVQRWHVETRVPSPRRDQKVRTTAHASHYCESCASRCSCYSATSRARRAIRTYGSSEKSRSHHDRRFPS